MNKNKIIVTLCFIVIIVLMLISFFPLNISNTGQQSYKSIPINSGENIYVNGSNIYVYGKIGLKIYNDDNLEFESSFTYENPVVATDTDKIAIGDKNSKTIRLYNSSSLMYTLNMSHSILGFNVNLNGYCSVIMKVGEYYQVEVFNNFGESAYTIRDISLSEGIPITSTISPDNKVMAVAYLKINESVSSTNISVHYIDESQLFAGFVKFNQIVGILSFTKDNNLIGASDKELFIIEVNTNKNMLGATEVYRQVFGNNIKYIKFLNNQNFAIYYGTPLFNNENSFANNTLVIYNSSGTKRGEYTFDDVANDIFVGELGVVLAKNRFFIGVNRSGNKVWEYQAIQDIKQVEFYGKENYVAIVTNDEIRLTKINSALVDTQLISEQLMEQQSIKDEEANTQTSDSSEEFIEETTEETTEEITNTNDD